MTKILLSVLLILISEFSFANNYTCIPNFKITTSPEGTERVELKTDEATKNALKIKKSGSSYLIETRDNIKTTKNVSGIYEIYYSPAFTAKIETTSKSYFEFVHIGLGTITYFGKCL
jgi:hypothetical protein